MTRRAAQIDAGRWACRSARLIAGLLCAVLLLSGATLHPTHTSTHHVDRVVAAAALPAAGQQLTTRDDHHLIAVAAITATQTSRFIGAQSSSTTSLASVAIHSVRTRGPPESV